MPRYGTKISYVASLICMSILIFYLWFIFLPQFEGKVEYTSIRIIVTFVVLLLLMAAGIQIFLLRKPPSPEEFNN